MGEDLQELQRRAFGLEPLPKEPWEPEDAQRAFAQWASLTDRDEKELTPFELDYLSSLEKALTKYGEDNPEGMIAAYAGAVGLTPEQLAADPQAAANQAISDLQTLGLMGGDTARKVSEQISRETDLSRTISLMTRQYVEVETPDEFLDNFVNGLRTHVLGLTQTGELSTPAAMWAMDNANLFLDQYLGELGQKAARGEDIYKVVGVEGEPKKLGTRPGAVETGQTITAGTEQQQSVRSAVESILSGAVGGVAAGGAVRETTETATQEKFKTAERESMVQQLEVFQMPKIAQVATLSPLDFLKTEVSAKQLMAQFRTVPGTQRAVATRPAGEVLQPRRVR